MFCCFGRQSCIMFLSLTVMLSFVLVLTMLKWETLSETLPVYHKTMITYLSVAVLQNSSYIETVGIQIKVSSTSEFEPSPVDIRDNISVKVIP